MDDRPIFLIKETNYWGKERYYNQFINHLKNLNVDIDNFTFYILNVSDFSPNGDNLFFVIYLVPYLNENAISYEMINFNPINGEVLPPSLHLYLNVDKGGKRELLGIRDGEVVSFVGIRNSPYRDVYIYNPDIIYESGRTRVSPVFIACRDRDKLEKLIQDVYYYSLKKFSNCSPYIFHNGKDLRKRPSVTWDDLILSESIKRDIRSNVETFFNEREFFLKRGLSYKRGFLFVGPPGNGKTMLCRVIAGSYRDVPFIYYQDDRGLGAFGMLDTAFDIAAKSSPSILCLEDIDVILKQINISTVLNLIDGLSENEGIFLIATTNHPECLDQNILNRPSRFDRIWMIPNPDEGTRFVVLKKLFADIFDETALRQFVIETEGFSMAYMKEILISSYILAKEAKRTEPSLEDVQKSITMLKRQLNNGERLYEQKSNLGFVVNDEENLLV